MKHYYQLDPLNFEEDFSEYTYKLMKQTKNFNCDNSMQYEYVGSEFFDKYRILII